MGHVLPERGDHVDLRLREKPVEHLGQSAHAGVGPGDVGRQQEYPFRVEANPPAGLVGGPLHQLFQTLWADLLGLLGKPGHRKTS